MTTDNAQRWQHGGSRPQSELMPCFRKLTRGCRLSGEHCRSPRDGVSNENAYQGWGRVHRGETQLDLKMA